jgi:mandelate racemase
MSPAPEVRPPLKIRSLDAVAVSVPMRLALVTSAETVREAPLLLIDLATEEGVVGRTYVFCYRRGGSVAIAAVLREAMILIAGDPVSPVAVAAKLERRYALLGVSGVVRMALAALDMALWDALAVAAGLPLATMLGATPRPLPAYNSCGLGLIAAEAAADEAERLLAGGFKAVKEKRGRALAEEGVYWLEEPIRHDDFAGCAMLARELRLPVQIGENFNGVRAMARALDAGACNFVMPDAARIGGVTGWQYAAGIAAAHGIEMSSHILPEVSAHLLAASPTAHWLEYVDWANPILAEPLIVADGRVAGASRPGSGISWNQDAVARYRVE